VSIAEAYKAQEQARQNAVSAARWAGVAQVEQGRQEAEKKTWAEETKIWFQEKVDTFVRQPLSWMSISYQTQPFDPKNLFTDEMIYPQFSARNGFETWMYQSASISIETTSKLTSNPSGWVDLNFSNGRITFKGTPDADGRRTNYFIQPFALSFGYISLTPTRNPRVKTVNVSTYDFDVLSLKNWASLKISHSVGTSSSDPYTLPTGEKIEKTESFALQGTVSIHRWPRILVVAGVLYYVWAVAGVGVALKAGVEALVSMPLFQQIFQGISR
jgi:hypothetical protein